jgi:hypothetical protein
VCCSIDHVFHHDLDLAGRRARQVTREVHPRHQARGQGTNLARILVVYRSEYQLEFDAPVTARSAVTARACTGTAYLDTALDVGGATASRFG